MNKQAYPTINMKSLLFASVGAIAIAAPAAAQQDTIVITAAKREQTLQEVPIAVSVVGADSIEKARALDLIDLQNQVPSFRIGQLQNSTQTTFTIRGFGNGANNPGIESSVGVFIDGVFRSRSASAILDLPTVERVEVLRGPQSTLFGKNTSAGAISITTKKPDYEFGGSLEGSYGNFDAINLKGTVTGPIAENLAFRVSGSYTKADGFYENEFDGSDIGERNRWASRAQLLFEPTDDVSFRLIGEYNRIDEVCCGVTQLVNGPTTFVLGSPAVGGIINNDDDAFDRSMVVDVTPTNELVGKGLSLQADWNVGIGEVTSITAYRDQTDDSQTDGDFTSAAFVTNPQEGRYKTFTQEVRIASTVDGPFSWLLGGFFFDEEVEFNRDVLFGADTRTFAEVSAALIGAPTALQDLETALPLPPGTLFADGSGVRGEYVMDNRSFSLFGQVDYELTDRITLSGGLAYINDRKEVVGNSVLTDVFSQLNFQEIGFAQAFGTLTGLPPTPANIATNLGAAGLATTLSTTPCTAATAPNCNQLLEFQQFQFFGPQVNFPDPSNPVDDGILQDDQITYTARITYDVTDFASAYFTYSTGWKAGAFNLSSDSTPPNAEGLGRSADPEDVTLYEVGLKAQFDMGYINIALFHQTIEGFQSNLFNGLGFTLDNAGEQSVQGFEVESAFTPAEGLDLTFGLTYLDPDYPEFREAPCISFADAPASVCPTDDDFFDASGFRPAGISPVSIATSATYTHVFPHGAEGFVRLQYTYESPTQLADNIPRALVEREVSTLDASAGYELENGIGVSIWARNLNNNNYFQQAFPTSAQAGTFSAYTNAPRTFGGTVRYRF